MVEITIPFNDWSKEKLEDGRKIATTRRKPYGDIGDTFTVFLTSGLEEYVLVAVFPMKLGEVARFFYWMEGCESPDDFQQVWCDIHKKAGWTPDLDVWVHLFQGAD
jgi:hypothetical protein